MKPGRTLVAVVGVLAISVAGCGGGSSGGAAGAFMKKVFTNKVDGNFSAYYDELHPAQQALFSKSQFTRCLQKTRTKVTLQKIKVLDVYDSNVNQQGISQRKAKVVIVRIVLSRSGQTVNDIETAFAVKVNGDYRWVLGPTAASQLAAGKCPGT